MLTYAKPVLNPKNPLGNWLIHLGAWFAYMLYESFSVALATGTFSRITIYLLHYAVNILLFYFHAGVVLPLATSVKRNSPWMLLLLIVFEIALFLAFKFGIDHLIALLYPEMAQNEIILDKKFIAGGVWRSVYFILLASGYYYLRYYIKERDNREQLEKRAYEEELNARENLIELNNAKNAFLRAQINPHFLFNTLNFIYSRIHKADQPAAKTLSLLANIMRYALESGNGPGLIRVEDELGPAGLLLDLWKIRQEEENTAIVLDADDEAKKAKFVPLVILTLLENMLKHGNLSEKQHPGRVKIWVEDPQIILMTRNLINTGLNDSGHHTGLNNIRQRLFLTYGEEAVMQQHVEGNYFTVKISAPLR
ncbi:sensor histidine kinase [Pedobacter endophyticus]|uniref:Histidine kinase n=1 Tax=Pedobacter endophyticus TaxID=2789740 RepID=A0A7S9L151_9SPHI|nr:histidine kinase [Pedobacter endophyticus]QPH40576.1 histidine kinase [Pedobacter endophyticus]